MTSPIHTNDSMQHVDVRIYFPAGENREELLTEISGVLQDYLERMVSAYELVRDSFGQLVPDDKPLA